MIRFVPWALPANIITLISNTFVYLGLYLSLHANIRHTATPLLIACCFILYLIGDHLDGMQAKRTGTGSALGEFCDHYLDAFNNGIVVYTMFNVFGIENGIMISGVIAISYLAHMAVFYEQLKTGWLTFERIGSLEGVLISALLIALSSIDMFYVAMTQRLIADYTVAEIFILCSAVGALVTFFQTYKRTPMIENGYWLFGTFMLMIAVWLPFVLTSFETFIILTLYASLYIGRLMHAHLIDGRERQTDIVIPALLVLHYVTSSPAQNYLFMLLAGYLLATIMVLIVQTFSTLGIYWVWQNVKPGS